MKTNRAIYALYSNNKFVAWLYGAFCQLTKTPKFYWCGENHSNQTEIIITNLKTKLESVNKLSTFGQMLRLPEDNPIDIGQNRDNEVLKNYDDFTLGVFFVNEDECDADFLNTLKDGVPNDTFDLN